MSNHYKKLTIAGGLTSLVVVIAISIYSVFGAILGFAMSTSTGFFNGNATLLVIGTYDNAKFAPTESCDLDGDGPLLSVTNTCYATKGLTYYKNGIAQTTAYIARGTEFRDAVKATYGDPGPGYDRSVFVIAITDASGDFITVEEGDLFDIAKTNFYAEHFEGNDYSVGCNRNEGPICRGSICGNGRIEKNETCDDGNSTAGDGCSDRCQIEYYCGDGTVNPGEECDDGNNLDGDTCTSECKNGADVYDILAQLTGDPSDSNSHDFGRAVDINGDWAIVGDPEHDEGINYDIGTAYIFYNDPVNGWEKIQDLSAGDGVASDQYGYSVAISDTYAVVGTPYAEENFYSDTGKVYIYKYNSGTGQWDGDYEVSSSSDYAHLGISVATDGNFVVAGEPHYDSGKGQIYVLEYDDIEKKWRYTFIDNNAGNNWNYFGSSVDIDGNYIVVGEHNYDDLGMGLYDIGAIHTYEYVAGSWINENLILASDRVEYDQFGSSVAIDGDYIIAGTKDADANDLDSSGAAYIFYNNAGTWEEEQKLTADSPQPNTYFGWSVDIEGDWAIVGNPQMGGIGAAHLFYNNAGTWEHIAKLSDDTYTDFDMAYDVALSGGNLLVGRRYVDWSEDGWSDGLAYIYTKDTVVCGDGIIWGTEQCDDGNTASGDGCSNICQFEPGCGNGIIDEGEECDDGNTDSGDGCDAVCEIEYIGCYVYDEYVYGELNPTVTDDQCNFNCPKQGLIGGIAAPGGHGCLCWGGDNATCNSLCDFLEVNLGLTLEICGYIECGNSTSVNEDAETCDDGDTTSGDGCDSFCQIEPPEPVCGNDLVETGEQCDGGDDCTVDCKFAGTHFTRLDYSPAQDCIEPGDLCLYRTDTLGINNTINNIPFDPTAPDAGAYWTCGKCADVTFMGDFDTFGSLSPACIDLTSLPLPNAVDTCLYSTKRNTTYDVKWLSYTDDDRRGGGFEYVRNRYIDPYGPTAITDLGVAISKDRPYLTWSQSIDQGLGELEAYIIKYYNQPITEENWDSAKTLYYGGRIPEYAPNTFLPAGLTYFAIKSVDTFGNKSAISNVESIELGDFTPVVESISPASGSNDAEVPVEIAVSNVHADDTKLTAYFIGREASFSTTGGLYNHGTGILTTFVPAGVPAGVYKIRAEGNSTPSSVINTTVTYEVAPAENPLPVVQNIIPSTIMSGDSPTMNVYGLNLTGATNVAVVNVESGLSTSLGSISNITDTSLDVNVPGFIPVGIYNVVVTTSNGANVLSNIKLIVDEAYPVDETTLGADIDYYQYADLAGYFDQIKTQLQGDLNLYGSRITPATRENVSLEEIDVTIKYGTILTDDNGDPFIGIIRPPKFVSKDEAIDPALHDQLDEDGTIIFKMGSPGTKIYFSEYAIVQMNVQSDVVPIIWYYNESDGSFELAGEDAVIDGVEYKKGGIVLNSIDGTYTMGLALSHASVYLVGVTPTITNISPSSGPAGTSITITGTNFHPSATVTIGGQIATATVTDTEHISATVPSLPAGAQSVVVENPDLLSATSSFTIPSGVAPITPAVTVVPNSGGGGLGSGKAIVPTREQLLQASDITDDSTSIIKEEELHPSAVTESPVTRAVNRVRVAFKDISQHWAETYIIQLYNDNVISGKSEGYFAPDDPVTRAELIKIALNSFLYNVPNAVETKPFDDVRVIDWFAPYAQVAKENKIFTGFQGNMRPNEQITRAEALKILLDASRLSLTTTTNKTYSDTNPNAWYMKYVRYAYEKGIATGYADGTFGPGDNVTRAQSAKMTVKIVDLVLDR